MTLARAVIGGAGTGAWIGLLIGLIVWAFIPGAVGAVPSALIPGAVFGLVWAAIAYVFRQRAFASVPAVVADRYDVLVAPRGRCDRTVVTVMSVIKVPIWSLEAMWRK